MAVRDPLEDAAARAVELADAPVEPTHQWVADNLRIEIDPDAAGFEARDEIVRAARDLGLRWVGRKSETLPDQEPIVSDVFVDPTARAFVTARSRTRGGTFGSISSRYWIMTLFGDSTTIETSALPDPVVRSSPRVEVRGGTGDLARDLASHLAAVDARGPGVVVLPARDHTDVLRSLRIHYRRSISVRLAQSLRAAERPFFVARWIFIGAMRLRQLLERSKAGR